MLLAGQGNFELHLSPSETAAQRSNLTSRREASTVDSSAVGRLLGAEPLEKCCIEDVDASVPQLQRSSARQFTQFLAKGLASHP